MYVFLSLIRSVLCEHIILDSGNLEDLISKSHSVPVILWVYSSYCGHCLDVRPTWLQIAQEYSSAKDIILVEGNMARESRTISRIVNVNGYPAMFKITLGVVHDVRVEYSFNELRDFVEKTRKIHPLDDCRAYAPSSVYVPGPMFVFPPTESTQLACRSANTHCLEAGIDPSRCTISAEQTNCSLSVVYSRGGDVCIGDSIEMMREYSYDPFGDWPLHAGLKSSRRMFIVVYKDDSHWREFVPLQKQFAKDFLIGKMEHTEFVKKTHKSVSTDDLPLILVSNSKKTQFLIWKGAKNTDVVVENLMKIEEWDKEMKMSANFLKEKIWDNSRKWILMIGSGCVCLGFGSLALLIISQRKLISKKE